MFEARIRGFREQEPQTRLRSQEAAARRVTCVILLVFLQLEANSNDGCNTSGEHNPIDLARSEGDRLDATLAVETRERRREAMHPFNDSGGGGGGGNEDEKENEEEEMEKETGRG